VIILKPAHFFGEMIHLSPGWISNGHWAAKRELITNSVMLETIAQAKAFAPALANNTRVMDSDANIDKLCPKSDAPEWTITRWSYQTRMSRTGKTADLVLLTTNTTGDTALIDRKLLTLLGYSDGQTLFAVDSNSPFTNADRSILIMPFGIDKTDDPLSVIRSVVHLQDLRADERKEVA